MRKTARLKIEYQKLLDENKSLKQQLDQCMRAAEKDKIILLEKSQQLEMKNEQLEIKDLILEQTETKCNLSIDRINVLARRKNLYMVTTGAALLLSAYLLLR